jgi:hypothetical protein
VHEPQDVPGSQFEEERPRGQIGVARVEALDQ